VLQPSEVAAPREGEGPEVGRALGNLTAAMRFDGRSRGDSLHSLWVILRSTPKAGCMRRRLAVVGVVAIVLMTVEATIVWGSGERVRRATTQVTVAAGQQLNLDRLREMTDEALAATRCDIDVRTDRGLRDTLQCLKGELIRTQRALRGFVQCVGETGVTQYGEKPAGGTYGYRYFDPTAGGEILTTAIDFTHQTDDFADTYVLFLACAV
jgi:hypothetical protein